MPLYKVDDWDKVTKPAAGDRTVQDIRYYLGILYKSIRGTADHGDSLSEIYKLSLDWINNNSASHPIYDAMCLLNFSAKKRGMMLHSLDKYASEKVDFYQKHQTNILSDRHTYGTSIPSYDVARAQGLTGTLWDRGDMKFQHTGKPTQGLQLTISDLSSSMGNYWLEKADPLHRPWGHQGMALFEHWYDNISDMDFFSWIEHHRQEIYDYFNNCGCSDYPDCGHPEILDLLCTDKGVRYLTDQERWRYRIKFNNGLTLRRDPKKVQPGARQQKMFYPLSTQNLSTVFLGMGYAIWVCSLPGASKKKIHKFYSHSHKLDRFHHSSFLAGADVLAAGEWVVCQGNIIYISNKTGHYQASHQDIYNTLRVLQGEKQVDLTDTLVCFTNFNASPKSQDYYWAFDFLNAGGNLNNTTCISSVPLGQSDYMGEKVREWAANNFFPKGIYQQYRRQTTSFVAGHVSRGMAPQRRMHIGSSRTGSTPWTKGAIPGQWLKGKVR